VSAGALLLVAALAENDVFKKRSDGKTATAVRRDSKEPRLGFRPAITLEG